MQKLIFVTGSVHVGDEIPRLATYLYSYMLTNVKRKLGNEYAGNVRVTIIMPLILVECF